MGNPKVFSEDEEGDWIPFKIFQIFFTGNGMDKTADHSIERDMNYNMEEYKPTEYSIEEDKPEEVDSITGKVEHSIKEDEEEYSTGEEVRSSKMKEEDESMNIIKEEIDKAINIIKEDMKEEMYKPIEVVKKANTLNAAPVSKKEVAEQNDKMPIKNDPVDASSEMDIETLQKRIKEFKRIQSEISRENFRPQSQQPRKKTPIQRNLGMLLYTSLSGVITLIVVGIIITLRRYKELERNEMR